MSIYRYSRDSLTGDYVRAAGGLVLTAGPALAIPFDAAAQLILLPLAALFLVFAFRTWQRSVAQVRLLPDGICLDAPWRTVLAWRNLRAVRVSYYSTRSDRSSGWMQVTLKGTGGAEGGTIRIDSALDGFDEVMRHVAAAVRARGIRVSETTRANFDALGIHVDA